MTAIPSPPLLGKKALVLGIANEHSIAYGCARAFRKLGADLAITYLNDKAKPTSSRWHASWRRPIFEPLDVQTGRAVGSGLRPRPPDVGTARHRAARDRLRSRRKTCRQGCSTARRQGSPLAMDVSCHSFVRMARLAVPLMTEGGTLLAMTYHGANKVIPTYAVMGPVKAALEAAVRYLAYRAGAEGHPRSRRLARPDQDPRRVRAEGLRPAAERGRARGPRSASWWTSTMSAWPRPTSRRRMPGGSPAPRSMWMGE